MLIALQNCPEANGVNYMHIRRIADLFSTLDCNVVIAINKQVVESMHSYEKALARSNVIPALDTSILRTTDSNIKHLLSRRITSAVESRKLTDNDMLLLKTYNITRVYSSSKVELAGIESVQFDYCGSMLQLLSKGSNHRVISFDFVNEIKDMITIGYNDYCRLTDRIKLTILLNK